jgi:hypothetical protein
VDGVALPRRLSAEAADDPLGVEVLPACRWRGLRKSQFRLHELVYEVATGGGGPERLGKLGVIDEPIRIEGGPVVVCTTRDAIDDMVNLAGLMEQVADMLRALVDARNLRHGPRRRHRRGRATTAPRRGSVVRRAPGFRFAQTAEQLLSIGFRCARERMAARELARQRASHRLEPRGV